MLLILEEKLSEKLHKDDLGKKDSRDALCVLLGSVQIQQQLELKMITHLVGQGAAW